MEVVLMFPCFIFALHFHIETARSLIYPCHTCQAPVTCQVFPPPPAPETGHIKRKTSDKNPYPYGTLSRLSSATCHGRNKQGVASLRVGMRVQRLLREATWMGQWGLEGHGQHQQVDCGSKLPEGTVLSCPTFSMTDFPSNKVCLPLGLFEQSHGHQSALRGG